MRRYRPAAENNLFGSSPPIRAHGRPPPPLQAPCRPAVAARERLPVVEAGARRQGPAAGVCAV